ncbi:MAG: DNA polymerase III subunit delta [Rhodospirillales bacterium]
MKITASRIDRFLLNPGPDIAGILLFGPDQGLVRERAVTLAQTVVDDLGDPFRVVELTGAAIKADPAILGDEARQLSMTGGRKVIRVMEATDGITPAFGDFLDGSEGESLVIVEAGNLGARSSLRKLFQKAGNAASIGCYEDDARGLIGIINETLGRYGLTATPDALAFLSANLGGNRLVTRGELEKLALYAGGTDPGLRDKGTGAKVAVSLEDAMACIGDSAAMSLDFVAYAMASGNARTLDRALERALMEGTNPVGILRAAGRHLQRLHLALGMVEKGMPANKAIDALKPQVIFKFKDEFLAQVRRWTGDRLSQAMAIVTEAEIDCKTTGFPDVAGCHRALIRIAQGARAGNP